MEGLNSRLQLARKRARGYRNWKNFRTGCPVPSPTGSPAASTPERDCQTLFLSASEHHTNQRIAENLFNSDLKNLDDEANQ